MSDPVDDLEAAAATYRETVAAVEEIGEERLERLADAHGEFEALLDEYEESASGSGRETFQAYVDFQGEIVDFVERLPEDLLEREAFEEAGEYLDQRRLTESDFERAREIVAPAADLVVRLEERRAARRRYADARHAVEARRDEVAERIEDLESILAFEGVDFDAPVDDLREPVEAYNDVVRESFREFKAGASARAVLDLAATAAEYPLVGFDAPPEELREYLVDRPAGEEPIPTLLEYADYSTSKLEHYVENPRTFRGRVAANRTYLERLDADPLAVEWPPPSADAFRWRARELVAVVDRFASDEALERLRDLRALARDEERYARLREVARARTELDDDERARLESGAIADELADLEAERDRLEEALAEYPEDPDRL